MLCETDDTGTITAYYVQGPQLVARIGTDGKERYYHTNDIGSVMALTDDNEQIIDRYGYTPFGLTAAHEGTTPNPFTYVGGLGVMADADGLYFMRARFYDPATGRFLSKDPADGVLTEPQRTHRYVYGTNAPVARIDPSGRFDVIGTIDNIISINNLLHEMSLPNNTTEVRRAWVMLAPYGSGGYVLGVWDELVNAPIDEAKFGHVTLNLDAPMYFIGKRPANPV